MRRSRRRAALRAMSIRLCVLAVFGGSGAAHAHAYALFGHRLVYGVGGSQPYWIASSAKAHTGLVDSAMKNWINTSSRLGIRTPLHWVKTSTKSSARMEIHTDPKKNVNWCGLATFYVKDKKVDPEKKDWVWGKISLSGLFTGSSCPNRQGIVSHEMGHVFGLAHVSKSSTLMYSGISGTGVKWATKDEANGINKLY